MVVQPANKDTAPPILHSLLSIAQIDAQAFVAILPCDHHYSDEESFASALDADFIRTVLRSKKSRLSFLARLPVMNGDGASGGSIEVR